MKVIVWQWGRHGAGPRLAVSLAEGFASVDGVEALLSLSTGAEILRRPGAPVCELPVKTYSGVAGLMWRFMQAPITVMQLSAHLRRLAPQLAVCAMPGPLDLLMIAASHRVGIHAAVIVHDAEPHPGDRFPFFSTWQRLLIRHADMVVVLSSHVAEGLRANGSLRPDSPVIVATLPPFAVGTVTPPGGHPGPRRLLCFGRLRAYKGLDLLAEALRSLGSRADWEVHVVGQGPESAALAALRTLPRVSVENRWVPEDEIGALLSWADVVVLPYREASQSAIAPMALAAGRKVIATRVGGLPEQLEGEPLATLCAPDAAGLAAALTSVSWMPNNDMASAIEPREAWRALAVRVLKGFEHYQAGRK